MSLIYALFGVPRTAADIVEQSSKTGEVPEIFTKVVRHTPGSQRGEVPFYPVHYQVCIRTSSREAVLESWWHDFERGLNDPETTGYMSDQRARLHHIADTHATTISRDGVPVGYNGDIYVPFSAS